MKEFIKKIFGPAKLTAPKAVIQGFKTRFKNSKNAEWSQRGEQWEVLFYLENHETIAVFNAEGVLLEKRININIDTLPSAVSQVVKDLGEIMNAIQVNGGNNSGYEIIHRDNQLIRYVAFVTEDGVLVSNQKL